MSQSGQWGQQPSSQGAQTGQVKFFDPTKFQKSGPADFPTIPQQHQDAAANQTHQDPNQAGNAWTSWGDWNQANNPYVSTDTSNNAAVNQQNGTAVNNQLYGQDQWTQQQQQDQQQQNQQQQPYQNQMSFDQTTQQWNSNQQTLNPNVPEWNPNQFYQQQVDPSQQYGYNQTWSADNYYPQDVAVSQTSENSIPNSNVVTDTQSTTSETGATTNTQFVAPNSIAQSQTSIQSQFSHEEYSRELSNDVSQSTTESESQDVSQTTTESGSQSLDQSDQHYEGTMGGFFGNDDDNAIAHSEFYHHKQTQNIPSSDAQQSKNVATFPQSEFIPNTEIDSQIKSGEHIPNVQEIAHQMQTISLYDRQTSEPVRIQGNQHTGAVLEAGNSLEFTPHSDFRDFTRKVPENKPEHGNVEAPRVVGHSNDEESRSLDDWELVQAHGVGSTVGHSCNASIDNTQGIGSNVGHNRNASIDGTHDVVPTVSHNPNTSVDNAQTVGSTVSHSRNASLDNNVHFFISSTNSSQRVSPAGSAKSKKSEEPDVEPFSRDVGHVNPPPAPDTLPFSHFHPVPGSVSDQLVPHQPQSRGHSYGHVTSHPGPTSNQPPSQTPFTANVSEPPPQKPDAPVAPPLSGNLLGAPPPVGPGKGSNSPFRKSPTNYASPNIGGDSVLSSTRLDVTKTDTGNSPVILNQSISPIQPEFTQIKHEHCDYSKNRDIQNSERKILENFIDLDTPVSTAGQRKTDSAILSPIIHRKESAFQPPGRGVLRRDMADSRAKPVKASHTIPGIPVQAAQPDAVKRTQPVSESETEKDSGRQATELESDRRSDTNYGRKTPEWDRPRSSYGRKTPELDRQGRYGGRKTPDLDAGNKQSDRSYGGRKTPEWDRNTSERDGAKDRGSGDRYLNTYKERMDAYKERMEAYRERKQNVNDRVSSRPPVNPSSGARSASSRNGPSSLRAGQTHRSRNNVSPATTLWDTDVPAVSNILLVPTAGNSANEGGKEKSDNAGLSRAPAVLTPVASLITSLSEQIDTNDSDKVRSQGQTKNRSADKNTSELDDRNGYSDRSHDSRDRDRRDNRDNSRELTRNSCSYESDRGLQYSRNNSRDKLDRYGSRNSLERELRDDGDDRDRRRGNSRDRDRDHYRGKEDSYDRYYRERDRRDVDRPLSRTGTGERSRDGYRDAYSRRDEKSDRPRSRHDERRPLSRQGEVERPRSRTDYSRDQYAHDKNRGHDYDDYYRRGGQYYDRQYYDNYYANQSYQQGYYDDQGYYHSDPNASRYGYDQRTQRRSRVSTPGSLSEGGDEISQIEGKSKNDTNKSKRFDYPPELHDYSQAQYEEYYNYYGQYPEVNGHRWDPDVSAWVATTVEAEPQRQTPEKYIIPHVRATFGPSGQLVKVLPNRPTDGQPATIEIHEVQTMLEHNEDCQEYKEFPGPLVRGDTHKNDVLLFCQRKSKSCVGNMDLDDRESSELIWRLLELLIKQNGTVVGTDIADLILEGHEPTTMEYRQTGMRIAQSTDWLEGADDDVDDHGSNVTVDRTSVNKAKPVEELTDRFRHLLLYGRKKDALDWAMKNQLWGHALFLASKMDSRAHASVMTRFANVAMRMNDPLQTLYQLMSGRQPAAVTCVTEERWGDWRPHLAMILSNHTSRPDLDRKCITQLGDTLASKGYLNASHFCYLMSQTSFGSFNKKTSKIVLIGSSHNLPLGLFTNNEAIQCTEVYEYALALGNTSVSLCNFQYFKYLYATRLADCGFAQEAFQYCEVISRSIQTNPAYYTLVLVKLVYDLSCQLKFADPQRLEEMDDSLDPDWLRGLHTTLVQFEEGAIQPVSGPATPAYFPGTRASSESGEVGMYMQDGAAQGQSYGAQGQSYGAQGQGYSQDGNTYTQSGYMHGIPEQGSLNIHDGTSQYQGGAIADGHYEPGSVDQTQYIQQSQPGTTQLGTGQEGTIPNQSQYHEGIGNQSNYPAQEGQYQPTMFEGQGQGHVTTETQAASQFQPYHQSDATQPQAYNQDPATQASDPHQQQQQQQPASHGNFPPLTNLTDSMNSGTGTRHSIASSSSWTQDEDAGDGADTVDGEAMDATPGIFDIIQPNQPQKIIPPRLRKRTASETSTSSNPRPPHPSMQMDQSSSLMDAKSQKNSAGGGEGIWGKLGGLFSRKGKNEMKLPDDKEPAIVWDPVNNKWMNTDGDGTDDAPAAPPPKDADLTGKPSFSQPPSIPPAVPSMPSTMTEPTSLDTSSLAANRFQRRKGIGARSQYVDVLNPKPAANNVPSSLFHTLPSSQSAPAIFVPGGGASQASEDLSSPEPQPVQESIPEESKGHALVQEGAAHSLHAPTDNFSRTSSASSLNREVQRILAKTPAAPTTAGPAMFNPAQFQPGAAVKPLSAAPGHRLTNRRVYPKQGTS